MPSAPDHDLLAARVVAADRALTDRGADGAVLRVSDLAPSDEALAWYPLDGAHPLDLLLGFVAPLHWRALGVHCLGQARHLDEPRPPAHPADGEPSGHERAGRGDGGGSGFRHRPADEAADVTMTLLFDRQGRSAAVLRRGAAVSALPEAPEGTVADACRRGLGLPTAPAPASTLPLWTLLWLDRVVERAAGTARPRSWAEVAALHPAVQTGPAGAPARLTAPSLDPAHLDPAHLDPARHGPAGLVAAARELAAACPWARLRAEPALAPVPGPPPSPALAAWMDDGMWARWLLARLPSPDDLRAAVHALLPLPLAEAVDRVATAAWP